MDYQPEINSFKKLRRYRSDNTPDTFSLPKLFWFAHQQFFFLLWWRENPKGLGWSHEKLIRQWAALTAEMWSYKPSTLNDSSCLADVVLKFAFSYIDKFEDNSRKKWCRFDTWFIHSITFILFLQTSVSRDSKEGHRNRQSTIFFLYIFFFAISANVCKHNNSLNLHLLFNHVIITRCDKFVLQISNRNQLLSFWIDIE